MFTRIVLVVLTCCLWSAAEVKGSSPLVTPDGFQSSILSTPDGRKMNCHLRPGTGPTLVLVPGTWGDIHRFTSLIERLPESRSLAVVELCWQGGHVPDRFDFTINELADDVLWAIQQLPIKRFVIAGHSIGGMIAVEISGRSLPQLAGAIPMEGWTHHTVTRTAFHGVVVTGLTAEEQTRRQQRRQRGRRYLTKEQCDAIASIWRRWNGYSALERSRVPVLELWGDRSQPRPDRSALQIPDQPNIQIGWIKDASHVMVLEAPDQVADHVSRFLHDLPQ